MKLRWASKTKSPRMVILAVCFSISSWAVAEGDDKTVGSVNAVTPAVVPSADFIRYHLSTGSNVLPFTMMGKILTGGYVNPAITADIVSKVQWQNRAGVFQQMSLVVYPLRSRILGVGGKPSESANNRVGSVSAKPWQLQTISIRNVQSFGAKFTGDAFRLAFRGNGYYRGKKLAMGENQLEMLGYTSVDFQFKNKFKQHSWSVSLLQSNNFTRLKTSELELFTSAKGDSLSFNGRYYSQRLAAGSSAQGLGITVGFNKLYQLNRNSLWLSVHNLGFLWYPKVDVESRGYVWDASMKGLSEAGESPVQSVSLEQAIVNPKELQLSNWFGNQRDTVVSKLQLQNQVRSGRVLAPYTVSFELGDLKFINQTFSLNCTYLNVVGYKPSFRLIWEKIVWANGQQKWEYISYLPYVGMGGFDNYDLGIRLGMSMPVKRLGRTMMQIDFRGLEAWAMPKKQHGAGLMFGLMFKL